jgi:tetratricopeptide (TPR) repeat protein
MLGMANPETARERRSGRRRLVRRPVSTAQLTERAAVGALVVAIGGSALAFGALHPPMLVIAALASAAAAVLFGPSKAPKSVWFLLALAGYTALQMLPLPAAWIAGLSPASAAVWQGVLEPLGEGRPAWATLSVDPGGTALETLKWSAYACVLLAASAWRSRRGANGLAIVVFLSAFAVALVTLAHGAVDAPRIYGYFLPNGEFRWTRGPFVNGNNLAGYLNLGFFSGAGLWLSNRKERLGRFLPIGLFVIGIGVVLTGSRAGVGALLIGLFFMAVVAIRGGGEDWRRVAFALGAGFAVFVGAGAALGGERLARDLLDRTAGAKFIAWRWSVDLVRDFPVFGAGRGAFETAFQPYRGSLGRDWTLVFSHPENFAIQWIADWGLPVGIAVLVGFAVVLWGVGARVGRDPLVSGLVVGLAALVLQNLVDNGSEIFAVGAAALAVLAGARPAERLEPGWSPKIAAPLAVAVLGACVVVVASGARPVAFERQHFARAYAEFARSRSRDGAALRAELRGAMLRHPGEAFFPLVGAALARVTGQGSPLVWLGRSLERAPLNGNAHLILADVLAARGARSQALLHVRFAAVYDRTIQGHAYGRAVEWARTGDELVSVFPEGLPGSELLAELCEHARGEPVVPCWREASRRAPNVANRTRLVGGLLEALEKGRGPCDGPLAAGCLDEARRLLDGLEHHASADFRIPHGRVRLLAVEGKSERALDFALEGCPTSTEAADCSELALQLALKLRSEPKMERVAARFVAQRCADPQRCAEAHNRVAEAYAAIAAKGLALRHFGDAAKIEPSAERWIRLAEAAARAGSSMTARSSLQRASRAQGLSDEQRSRIAAVEKLLAAGGPELGVTP